MLATPLLASLDEHNSIRHVNIVDLRHLIEVESISESLKFRPWLCNTQVSKLHLCKLGLNNARDWLAASEVPDHTVLTEDEHRDIVWLSQIAEL